MPGEPVLIVEDHDCLSGALADALASLGYETIEAGTGGEAYALASRQVPDLILLDLGLPDVDGLSLARKLRGRPETARIVVGATTSADPTRRVWKRGSCPTIIRSDGTPGSTWRSVPCVGSVAVRGREES